jgi:hypothetical protein
MGVKLVASSGGSVELVPTNTASNFTVTVPAVTASMLTDSSGVMNIGSGQVYKDSSGNVGIGTASPSYKLDINNSLSQARLQSTTAGSNAELIFQSTARTWGVGTNIGTTSSFEIFDRTAGATRLAIDSSGNLLVGTTTFASGQNGVLMRGTSGGATDEVLQTRTAGTASTSATGFYNNNGRVGTISTSGTATAYNTSSDYRLKNSIAPMTGALDKVTQLKPCTYKWNADGSEGQGFIAHELAEIVPQCVHGEKDAVDADGNPVYQGIDTSFLVATLTAAIQEQQALITQLQADVAALKGTA